MNHQTVAASNVLSKVEKVNTMNESRTSWKLSEWSAYFDPGNQPTLTSEDIAAAVLWLTAHEYPHPTDCPKRPESSPHDGGCPAFKPMCLLTTVCQMARGMCNEIGTSATCPTCHKIFRTDSFRDSLSRKEFEISGMCQECQDRIFGR